MNAVYARRFRPLYPSRATIAVAALPLGDRVEIDAVARMRTERVERAAP